jgi:hypothetical protein
MFYEYGTIYLPAEARTLSRLTLPVIQSFVAVPVSLLATWYLVSERRVPRRGLSFGATVLAIAGTTAFVALLYDLTFLDQYLPVHPDARPGVEHALFAVVANALVAVSAFASVAVFFRTRGRLAQQLGSPSACSGEVDPVRR